VIDKSDGRVLSDLITTKMIKEEGIAHYLILLFSKHYISPRVHLMQ